MLNPASSLAVAISAPLTVGHLVCHPKYWPNILEGETKLLLRL